MRLTEFPYRTELGDKENKEKGIILTPDLRTLLGLINGKKTVSQLLDLSGLGSDVSAIEQLVDLKLVRCSNTPYTQSSSVNTEKDLGLEQAVSDALMPIFGKGIVKEISKIAKKTSPISEPVAFLDASKGKAAMLLSDEELSAIFSPLYNKL